MASPTLAFVSDVIAPYHHGGKESKLFHVTTRLARAGYDVHIYTMQWWEDGVDRVEHGVHLHAICPLYPLYDGHRRSIKQGVFFGLACFKLLFANFDVVDVDHMPFFPIYSMRLVCWLKGKKMFGTWNEVWGHAYWSEYLSGMKGKIATWIEQYSVGLPDHVISISQLTTQKLINSFGLSSDKITTVPCGYDHDSIAAAKPASETSDVIFVGRLLSHKHVDVLVQAIATLREQFPSIVCRIVGKGPELASLHTLVKSLKLEKHVVFHSNIKEARDVFSLMKSAKVFVLPSTREGFGIVALEANACGLPVITIDHPDNAAKDISQVAVPLASSAIADTAAKYLTDQQKIDREQLRRSVERYRWEHLVEQLKTAYGV